MLVRHVCFYSHSHIYAHIQHNNKYGDVDNDNTCCESFVSHFVPMTRRPLDICLGSACHLTLYLALWTCPLCLLFVYVLSLIQHMFRRTYACEYVCFACLYLVINYIILHGFAVTVNIKLAYVF